MAAESSTFLISSSPDRGVFFGRPKLAEIAIWSARDLPPPWVLARPTKPMRAASVRCSPRPNKANAPVIATAFDRLWPVAVSMSAQVNSL